MRTHLPRENQGDESEDNCAGGGENEAVPDKNAHSDVGDIFFWAEENVDWLGLAVVALISLCFCHHVADLVVGEEFLGAGSRVTWINLWKSGGPSLDDEVDGPEFSFNITTRGTI